uniref:C2H2-type domain-containing protein n=1 Tax=Oryzias sinensis TaxID=183150 RepID=A0A8C7XXJ9_9TELE
MTMGHKGEHLSPTAGKTPPYQINAFLDPDVEPEESEESVYSEPPDVQRQLNHYSLMARNNSEPSDGRSPLKLTKNRQLCCEFCNFHTEHPSSIRRHYMGRHGKKILRCKDCSFFTGLRKSLEMHIEAGHLTFQPTATYQKDFRCPFCLYQSKNKNHMIDHIVLHREERVVPIEVHRPKLSRYLQGIVFRCHRCTFTCGSAESLHFHMMRHSDLKPYKCRLCYFDCTLLKDLEKHLSDQHQVLRNHELVGQVSLDQLESRIERRKEKELDIQGLQDFDGDFSEAENMTNDDTEKKTILRELLEKRDEEGNGQKSAKSCTNLQCDATTPKSGLHEQALQSGALIHSTGGLQAASVDQRDEVQQDDCSGPRKPNQDNLHHSTLNADAEMEEDMANVLSTIKVEEDLQDNAVDLKLNKDDGISAPNDQVNTSLANRSSAEDTKDSSSPKPPSQTASPIGTDTRSVSLKTCKDELEQTSINSQEAPEHFGEMPVLENELLKKKLDSPENCKEEEEEDEGGRMVSDVSGTCDKKEDISPVDKGTNTIIT